MEEEKDHDKKLLDLQQRRYLFFRWIVAGTLRETTRAFKVLVEEKKKPTKKMFW